MTKLLHPELFKQITLGNLYLWKDKKYALILEHTFVHIKPIRNEG
jgi:hypothetical protein